MGKVRAVNVVAGVGRNVPRPKPTNKEFCYVDSAFKEACEKAQIRNTPRQASKWRSDKGKARLFRNKNDEASKPTAAGN